MDGSDWEVRRSTEEGSRREAMVGCHRRRRCADGPGREFESLGGITDEGVTKNADGSVLATAWVTDDQLAQFKVHGFEPVATLAGKFEIDAIRAERNDTLAKLKASIDALHGTGVKPKGKSAAGDIHAQRADYYEKLGAAGSRSRRTPRAPATPARAPTPTPARPSRPTSSTRRATRSATRS